jgi:hypothetical protein
MYRPHEGSLGMPWGFQGYARLHPIPPSYGMLFHGSVEQTWNAQSSFLRATFQGNFKSVIDPNWAACSNTVRG